MSESMRLTAPRGTKVRYAFPDAGWPADAEKAERLLTAGAVYTVSRTIIGSLRTLVHLEEIPGGPFNSVSFAEVVA